MKLSLLIAVCCTAALAANAQVNVTQKNNNPSRDGLYIDSAFTPGNAANLVRDLGFDGTIVGNVHAQPLYIEGGPNGPMIIAVTASNNVYALNATSGAVIWQRNLGTPPPGGSPCGNIFPVGIIGTPVVDLASRSLFLNAMISGSPNKHFIYSLNVDTGATNAGWPVDVNATASYNGIPFVSVPQEDRGALALVNGRVYVPYSGYFGDCGSYHGWVVGVNISNPANVGGWATTAIGGGIWGHSGVASDGTNMFVITGNTFNTGGNWMGGEAIIRLQAGPTFTGQPTDYWAPTNWFNLDQGDTDLGGVSAMLIDVPGANPSQLVLATGKDSNAYLLNRNNLGGIAAPVAQLSVGFTIGQSSATYRTAQGTYFVFRASSQVKAYKITATTPPTIVSAWTVTQSGQGSPWVTTTDGTNNAIVWVVGAQGDQRLHGYNGDTGAVVYAGGGANELMTGTRKWNTGIVARGSIYVANDNRVYAFRIPFRRNAYSNSYSNCDFYCHTYCNRYSYGKCDTNCYSNSCVHTHCYRDCYSDSCVYTHCYRDSYGYGKCDTNCDGNRNSDGNRNCHGNCDANRNSDGNCNCDANCDSDADCHSHRFRQSDTDTETKPHSETSHDAEAAPDTAAKAVRGIGIRGH